MAGYTVSFQLREQNSERRLTPTCDPWPCLSLCSSKVIDNQLTAAAGIVSGAAGSASLNTVNSEVRGNMVRHVPLTRALPAAENPLPAWHPLPAKHPVENLPLQSANCCTATLLRRVQVASAGGLALSATADASAAGSGGAVAGNAVAAAGLIATGGLASARASLDTVGADGNGLLGVGLPFTEEPLVSSIISTVSMPVQRVKGEDADLRDQSCTPTPVRKSAGPTMHATAAAPSPHKQVMNAVFVDSSSLSTGLANTQAQLCASLSAGGSLDSFAYEVGLSAVRSVAWELLCDPGSASHVQLSDIPGMLDGSAGAGPLGTLQSLRLLATVRQGGWLCAAALINARGFCSLQADRLVPSLPSRYCAPVTLS